MFRHPKYYKELRKRNKSDQVISRDAHDGERERAPGPGLKPQATSFKLQATSSKLLDPWTTKKFHGTWTKGLYHDESIVWMFDMKANLVWWESYFIPFAYL